MTYRQYEMLAEIKHYPKSFNNALELNQLIFGSLCYKRYVEWNVDRNYFKISEIGLVEFNKLKDWCPIRKINNNKISIRANILRKVRRIA